jgi:chromosome segregation ATPase
MSDTPTALKYLTKDFEEFKDDIKDQMNDLKADRVGTKKGIYEYIDKKIEETREEVKMIEKTLNGLTKEMTRLGFKILWGFLGFAGTAIISLVIFIYLNGIK